jgi:hypothetical protein
MLYGMCKYSSGFSVHKVAVLLGIMNSQLRSSVGISCNVVRYV